MAGTRSSTGHSGADAPRGAAHELLAQQRHCLRPVLQHEYAAQRWLVELHDTAGRKVAVLGEYYMLSLAEACRAWDDARLVLARTWAEMGRSE